VDEDPYPRHEGKQAHKSAQKNRSSEKNGERKREAKENGKLVKGERGKPEANGEVGEIKTRGKWQIMYVRRHEICDWNLVDDEEASPATAPEILLDALMMMMFRVVVSPKWRG
jgi:hypothetical protein